MYACITRETFVFTVFRRVFHLILKRELCRHAATSQITDMSIWKKRTFYVFIYLFTYQTFKVLDKNLNIV